MAVVFQFARLIPLALRVSLAGGVTYGTVKIGAWSDGKESRERLEQLQNIREIEYPPFPETTEEQGKGLVVKSGELSSLKVSLVQGWNNGVRAVCRSLSSDHPLFHSEDLRRGWKKVTAKVRQWTDKT